MLTPEQAKEQLKHLTDENWLDKQLAAIAALPDELRPIAYAFVGRDENGYPDQSMDMTIGSENWQSRHEKQRIFQAKIETARRRVADLDNANRQVIFAVLFEKLADAVERGWQWFVGQPYIPYSWQRFRVPDEPSIVNTKRVAWVHSLHQMTSPYPQDVTWFAIWISHLYAVAYGNRTGVFEALFAAAIEANDAIGDEIFNILMASIRGDHKIGGMTQTAVDTLLAVDRPAGWNYLESLLLAAQRQEGLRQSILQNLPSAHPTAFLRFLHIIVDQDLSRFSATVNSLNQWFGFQWEAGNSRPINEWITDLIAFLEQPSAIAAALQSGTAQETYLALWTLACQDAYQAADSAAALLADPIVERRFAASIILNLVQLDRALPALLIALNDSDVHVVVVAYWGIFRSTWGSMKASTIDQVFDRLTRLIPRLPKTDKDLTPMLWDWLILHRVTQQDAANLLPGYLGTESPKRLIPFMPIMRGYMRAQAIKKFDDFPDWDAEIRRAVFDQIGEMGGDSWKEALKAILKRQPTDAEILQLEVWLTRKTANFRNQVIAGLVALPDPPGSASRLLASRNELQRLAGLEILRLLPKTQNSEIRRLATTFAPRNEEEKLLISNVLAEEQKPATLDDALGLSDPADRSPLVPPVKRDVVFPVDAAIACLISLDAFIDQRKDTPITIDTYNGEHMDALLGGGSFGYWWSTPDKALPLADLWEEWYRARTADQRTSEGFELVTAAAYIDNSSRFHPVYSYSDRFPARYSRLMNTILHWLNGKHTPEGLAEYLIDGFETILYALIPSGNGDTAIERQMFDRNDSRLIELENWCNEMRASDRYAPPTDTQSTRRWQLIQWLNSRYKVQFGGQVLQRTIDDIMSAHELDVATSADVFAFWMSQGWLQQYAMRKMSPALEKLAAKYPALIGFIDRSRERIVEVELDRGESDTAASDLARSLGYSGGLDVLIRILQRFGKNHVVHPGYGNRGDKTAALSHLVKVSYPAESDTPEAFAKAVKAAAIPSERLVELALYAPQWAVHVDHALKQKGFLEGVWWIYAHTKHPQWGFNVQDKAEWTAQVAQRTPLTAQDLLDGAVDVDWFRRMVKTLGLERWAALYKSANFATDGIGHKRAQLFASAMLGDLDLETEIKRITDKRHQDSVRALGLIPLAKGKKREIDLLHRYQIFQEFRRTSKQFGSQRRESEALAVQIGMQNLARTAGYPDPLRLQWAMEQREVADLKDGGIIVEAGETSVALTIDPTGEVLISATKKGKPLKAIPPAAKKIPAIVELIARGKALEQQASRMRAALETAMVRGDQFTASELRDLTNHPILVPLLNQLLFVRDSDHTIGLFDPVASALRSHTDDVIQSLNGADPLRIAHPCDFLDNREWSQWQRYFFDRAARQPFKQVFRELYLLTPQEGGSASRRYTGHQIQTRQATALLGARGWIEAGYQSGEFTRTFHREAIVANVNFRFVYGTPAQVEAPVIDSITFTRRDSWKPIPLADVPPRLFSEIMRDVDLVVSVAHVGGVDPEASASTVEMRATLVEETARLLKLANVRVQMPHVIVKGSFGDYSIHLGSATVHRLPGGYVCIIPVSSQQRGRLFLPFMDDDPRSAEVIAKVVLLAHDAEINDPVILQQLRR